MIDQANTRLKIHDRDINERNTDKKENICNHVQKRDSPKG